MKRKVWTDKENAALIALYKAMRAAVDNGEKYNKAKMIREARSDYYEGKSRKLALGDRSRGSIEAKLMNVTACLDALGHHDQSMHNHGYKAAPNYQRALFDAVMEAYK